MVKETQALLAHADLNEGKYASALATLDGVLDHHGADIVPRWVPRAVSSCGHAPMRACTTTRPPTRTCANTCSGRGAATDADRARSGRVLRARFRVDNEMERNASLQRELSLSKERSDLQREQLQRRTEVMAAGVALIALLIYILCGHADPSAPAAAHRHRGQPHEAAEPPAHCRARHRGSGRRARSATSR